MVTSTRECKRLVLFDETDRLIYRGYTNLLSDEEGMVTVMISQECTRRLADEKREEIVEEGKENLLDEGY